MIEAIIFDFDGVIADTEMARLKALIKYAKDKGYTPLSEEDGFRRIVGRTSREFLTDAYPEMNEETITYIVEQRRADTRQNIAECAEIIDGIKETLEELSKYRLAICSGSTREIIKATISHFGIENKFIAIVGQDDVDNLKPHPQPYLLALERLGVLAENAVAIEDTAIGIESAKKAGMPVIGFRNRTYEKYGYMPILTGANFVVDNLRAIPRVVERL